MELGWYGSAMTTLLSLGSASESPYGHTHAHMHTHTRTYAHTHTRICTHTHAHMYTHTRMHTLPEAKHGDIIQTLLHILLCTYLIPIPISIPFPIHRSTERQLLLFDINDLSKPKGVAMLEVSPSTLVPHFDKDTNVLFLAGKGDRSVYAFEFIPGQWKGVVAFDSYFQSCICSPPCSSPVSCFAKPHPYPHHHFPHLTLTITPHTSPSPSFPTPHPHHHSPHLTLTITSHTSPTPSLPTPHPHHHSPHLTPLPCYHLLSHCLQNVISYGLANMYNENTGIKIYI